MLMGMTLVLQEFSHKAKIFKTKDGAVWMVWVQVLQSILCRPATCLPTVNAEVTNGAKSNAAGIG